MEVAIAQVINGLALGGTYALLVTGMNLMLLVARVYHFAYPHIVVMSMYISWMVLQATGDNLALGILAAIGSGVVISIATEPLFRGTTKRGATIMSLFIAIGLAMVITDTQSHAIHGGAPISFPTALSGKEALLKYGIATINAGQLAAILGCVGAVAGLMYLLYRTKQGRAFRAIAQNIFVARLTGIPILRTSIFSYVIAGLLGGITAVSLIMAMGMAMPGLGDMLAAKVMTAQIFAGLGNLGGGIICAFILGLVESFTMGYLPGMWTDAVGFGVMMIGIIIRPKGVFGSRV